MNDTKLLFKLMEDGYRERRKYNNLTLEMLKGIIESYYYYVEKPVFRNLVEDYKLKYIYNEARVETNISKEEQLGLGVVYDYICDFDYEKDYFNIFVTSLLLHQKLYSKCPNKEYGGKLRDSSVYLYDSNIEIVEAIEAQRIFNNFITKSDLIFNPLKENDIFGYINSCIELDAYLIKLQPFMDGNKRTFRALLNLLLKRIEIPPIYVETHERNTYKDYLLNAMKSKNYSGLIYFYYLKICDAIMELNLDLTILSQQKIKEKRR